MSGLGIFVLIVQGVLFALWTFLMFRALFGIMRRFHAETGNYLIGPSTVIAVYAAYLKDPTYRTERRIILLVLGLLMALSILSANVL